MLPDYLLSAYKHYLEETNTEIEIRRSLRKSIEYHFKVEELAELCFDLNIDFQNLKGQTKSKKVLSLLEYVTRHNRSEDLYSLLARERPQVDWPKIIYIPQKFSTVESFVDFVKKFYPININVETFRGDKVKTEFYKQYGDDPEETQERIRREIEEFQSFLGNFNSLYFWWHGTQFYRRLAIRIAIIGSIIGIILVTVTFSFRPSSLSEWFFTKTPTITATQTATATATVTASQTTTATLTPTLTVTASPTSSVTPTLAPSTTPTLTPSATLTVTASRWPTATPTNTNTPIPTATDTVAPPPPPPSPTGPTSTPTPAPPS